MVAKIANRRSTLRYVTVQLLRAPIAFGISIPVTLLGGPRWPRS